MFLLIPFDRKLDWRRPPLVTFALVLINLLVYFVFQSDEDQHLDEALTYYARSGLADIEIPRYRDYLREHDPEDPLLDIESKPRDLSPEWYLHLEANFGFRQALESGKIVRPNDAEYSDWLSKRRNFEEKLAKVTYYGYGLIPARPTARGLVGHMFLHGSIDHLLSNMFFLIAVGFLVESTLGRAAFLACYLVGGLVSASFDLVFSAERLAPGLGASGAIAGLMGMYAVLYWTRKVRFFYYFIAYFDYVSLPAIALLPLWLTNEGFHMIVDKDSHINNLAHFGGLCGGALLALLVRRWLPSFSLAEVEAEDRSAECERRLAEARALCEKMEHRRAWPLLRKLHQEFPEDRGTLVYLHQCSRLEPQSDEYHRLSQRILGLQDRDPATHRLVVETFEDYLKRARPGPRLSEGMACGLLERFLDGGNLAEAERMAGAVTKKSWRCRNLSRALHRLGYLLAEAGHPGKGERYRGLARVLTEESPGRASGAAQPADHAQQ